MRQHECREGVVVSHAETGGYGVILRGGYRPRVRWYQSGRTVRTAENLLHFVAPDEITYRRNQRITTKCDKCGDESNSAPEILCGRVDDKGGEPCTGTYREAGTYVITASVYVDGVRTPQEAVEAVEEFNRGGEYQGATIDIRLPDPDSGFEWSYVGKPEED